MSKRTNQEGNIIPEQIQRMIADSYIQGQTFKDFWSNLADSSRQIYENMKEWWNSFLNNWRPEHQESSELPIPIPEDHIIPDIEQFAKKRKFGDRP